MRTTFTLLFSALTVTLCAAQPLNPYSYSGTKRVVCRTGAVVSAHALASRAGVNMLRQGGNAVDAVLATQLALAVVYPAAGNLGGGGFAVIRLSGGKTAAIDFREKAPERSTRDMYLDGSGNPMLNKSQNGHLSSGVPGAVAGVFTAMKYGRLSIKKLIQPAIELAEKGFVITAAEARGLNANQDDFKKYNSVMPVFVKSGGWKAGDTLVQADLAKTLKLIRDHGAKGFYEGETARLLLEEMQRGKGIVSAADLQSYTAREREPMMFDYKKDYRIITMPLPASGGVLLPQMMRMVEDQDLHNYGFLSARSVHLMVEVERLAYADRAKFLGDPDFVKVPVRHLISYPYLYNRMTLYNPDSAGTSEKVTAGQFAPESKETTHLEAFDKEGNAVSMTTTLNDSYGSKTVVAGAGFLLNDEMDDFSVKPGVANMYGALGGEANAIAPGKRMLSSMTPTIVLKNDSPYLVVGTPGGTTITTSVFQTLIDVIEFNLSASDAVNKPKFHHQWQPDSVFYEKGFPEPVLGQLRKMGYRMVDNGPIGRTELILIGSNGEIEAVGDGRGDDAADGF